MCLKKKMKKPGLRDRGMVTDIQVKNLIEKKNDPVCQTVIWSLAG